MKKAMIVIDLDDTLLRRDKTISDYSKDVLRRCRRLIIIQLEGQLMSRIFIPSRNTGVLGLRQNS